MNRKDEILRHKHKGKFSKYDNSPGFVYVFSVGYDNLYKIGHALSWRRRLMALKAGNPRMAMELVWEVGHMKREERRIHLKCWGAGKTGRYFSSAIEK